MGVIAPITQALSADGIDEPFLIQAMCIPQALEGRDIIGQAKTGTGKTLGFGVPLLQRIANPGSPEAAEIPEKLRGRPQALVVVPTRELCVQVAADLKAASRNLGTRVVAIYGGRAYEPQVEALVKGAEVVVGTPGRLIDLARQRKLDLKSVKVLVLDEADEMLDMGFLPDVERIVSMLPPVRQTMLFSATMPAQIVSLGRRYMTQPTHIRAINPDDDANLVDAIEQHVWRVHPLNKVELLTRILQAQDRGLTMIFSRTKRRAQQVADDLTDRGFAAAAVHGDLGQGAREQALRAFRSGKVDVLVATDVAARGIDVDDVTHVINHECPDDEKTYVHRVGRTGRAGKAGVAVTFVDWEDVPRWQLINKALGLPFHEPVETYHNSEHVYAGLGINADAPARLPKAARTRAGLDAEAIEDIEAPKSGRRDREHGNKHAHLRTRGGKVTREPARQGGQGGTPEELAQAGVEAPRPPRKRSPRKRTRRGQELPGGAGAQPGKADDPA
ncbi:MAG: DEAD/DEAH box helicase [Candidatus Nanopelagicales bacterium]